MFVVQFVANRLRGDRPEDWVPEEGASADYDSCNETSEILPGSADNDVTDILSGHSYHNAGTHFLFLYCAYYSTGCHN
jgi:hypothetical protein